VSEPKLRGVVVQFDEHVGLGVVRGDDEQDYPFHCTQIAGGSRTIDEGTPVEFVVVPRLKDRLEAYDLTPSEP